MQSGVILGLGVIGQGLPLDVMVGNETHLADGALARYLAVIGETHGTLVIVLFELHTT